MRIPRSPPSIETSITRVISRVETQDQNCRHRNTDAEGERFTCDPAVLHHIVLEDRRFTRAKPREECERARRR